MLSLSLNTPPKAQLEVHLHLLQLILYFGFSYQLAFKYAPLNPFGQLFYSWGLHRRSSHLFGFVAPPSLGSPTWVSTFAAFSLFWHSSDLTSLNLVWIISCIWIGCLQFVFYFNSPLAFDWLLHRLRFTAPFWSPFICFFDQIYPSSVVCRDVVTDASVWIATTCWVQGLGENVGLLLRHVSIGEFTPNSFLLIGLIGGRKPVLLPE